MENVIKLILGFAIIVFITLLSYQLYDIAHDESLNRLKENLEEIQEGNAKLAQENALLQVRIRALREDPRTIERKVRDELGLVRRSEVVVLLNQ